MLNNDDDGDLGMYSEVEEINDIEDRGDINEETIKQRSQRQKYEYQSFDPKRREYINYELLDQIIKSGKHEGKKSTDIIKTNECIVAAMRRVLSNAGEKQILTKAATITRHVVVIIILDLEELCLVKSGHSSWRTMIVSTVTVVISSV